MGASERTRNSPRVNLKRLLSVWQTIGPATNYAQVRYRYGAKPPLGAQCAEVREADCSGFLRWLLHQAGVTVPDGSVNQRQWVQQQGWRQLAQYSDVRYAAQDPSRLFMCFLPPRTVRIGRGGVGRKTIPGHVWLVHQGYTIECHSAQRATLPRRWNAEALNRPDTVAYEVPVE